MYVEAPGGLTPGALSFGTSEPLFVKKLLLKVILKNRKKHYCIINECMLRFCI